jgi:hypothetical protein
MVVHIYSTRHAWVEVHLELRTGTVTGFAITVTDSKFHFSVETLTFGQFPYGLVSPRSPTSPTMSGAAQTASGGVSALGAFSTLSTTIGAIRVATKIMSSRSISSEWVRAVWTLLSPSRHMRMANSPSRLLRRPLGLTGLRREARQLLTRYRS